MSDKYDYTSQFNKVFVCEYCGLPKVHTRLAGYVCRNWRCNERILEDALKVAVRNHLKAKRNE